MMHLVWFELVKTFTRWRTYIGFLAFGMIVPLVVAGLKLGGRIPLNATCFPCCRTTS